MKDTTVVIACAPSSAHGLADHLRATHYRVRVVPSTLAWIDGPWSSAPFCAVIEADDDTLFEQAGWDRLRSLGAAVVIVHGANDLRFVVRAMREGVVDVLTKPVDGSALLAAVALALEKVASFRRDVEGGERARALLARCTSRERAILVRATCGLRNKVIADDLDCTEATVKVHRSRAMRKLGLRSLADLVRLVDAVGGPAALEVLPASRAKRSTTTSHFARAAACLGGRSGRLVAEPDRAAWPALARASAEKA